MKPIIIAGNGPSLAQIDYSRLPKDFDVFRCNQFYFEPQYFLGKKIKGVFFNPFVLKEQFFTLHHLKERGEYEVEDVYCNITMGLWDRQWSNGKPKNLEQELRYDFPSVKNTYPFLEQMSEFNALHKFYALYYEKRFTAGIIMLIVALAQGYKEIYLTGIDFYEAGGLSYAFDMGGKSNLAEKMPTFTQEDFRDEVHEKNVDIEALKLALSLQDIKLYSLAPQSTMSEIVPLAPIQGTDFELLAKPKDYICDFVPLPQKEEKPTPTPPPIESKNQGFLARVWDYKRELFS
ncbi:alpha-2,3-sialyltransferase [Helicobacter brantae]|uniref:Alpha-2,3 sialyltransferase n=1 Tax=Helicobacter brantae TaxID=375927 RepID=A0A3D8J1M6_9HELI|nr:alpha-2,3-sialyltransferase [Helicobacter brantae]RDU71417.1 alpha-2,3 sialyltransferase [Helicobacter brantae]